MKSSDREARERHATQSIKSPPTLVFLAAGVFAIVPFQAVAAPEITPSLAIKESLVDAEGTDSDESGSITTLTPAISLVNRGARSSLLLDYEINAVYHQSIDREDRDVHLLNLFADYEHTPGKWVSALRASSQLSNIDSNGLQNIDPEFIDDNTRELRILAVNTNWNDTLANTLQYRVGLSADYADYADSDDGEDTEGRGALLGLDNFRSAEQFTWGTTLNSQISEDDNSEEQIDSLNIRLNYRFNWEWSAFVNLDKTEVDVADFEDESKLVGVSWRPDSNTFFSLGVGEREDEDSYSLDAEVTRRNVSYTATYREEITTSRTDTLNQREQDGLALATTQSISVVPVLQKRFLFNVKLSGKRSDVQATLFRTDRSESTEVLDETIDGLRLSYTRQLSARENLTISLLEQEVDTLENSELVDFDATYGRTLSKDETLSISMGWAEQESTSEFGEYERTVASVAYKVRF